MSPGGKEFLRALVVKLLQECLVNEWLLCDLLSVSLQSTSHGGRWVGWGGRHWGGCVEE